MPYGLVNAPSVFQDFMHEVLWEYLHRFVLVYTNDILIYSRSLAEHRHHVPEALQRLWQLRLFLKAEKCSFHQPSVQFLCFHIDSSGIQMDEGKVEAIKTWPQPSRNFNASWDSPTSTAASYRPTVPLPIHSRTYSATSPSLCPGP